MSTLISPEFGATTIAVAARGRTKTLLSYIVAALLSHTRHATAGRMLHETLLFQLNNPSAGGLSSEETLLITHTLIAVMDLPSAQVGYSSVVFHRRVRSFKAYTNHVSLSVLRDSRKILAPHPTLDTNHVLRAIDAILRFICGLAKHDSMLLSVVRQVQSEINRAETAVMQQALRSDFGECVQIILSANPIMLHQNYFHRPPSLAGSSRATNHAALRALLGLE